MAFTTTITSKTPAGNKFIEMGTYESESASVGGDIVTSLLHVDHFQIQPKGSSVTANQSVVNETLPLAGGTVTIVTDANQLGTWMAVGY